MIASLRLFYPIRERLRIGIELGNGCARTSPSSRRAGVKRTQGAGVLDWDIPSGYDRPIGRNTDI